MPTDVIEEQPLAWDVFLEREAERQRVPELRRDAFMRGLRLHVDGFRRTEWLNLKRQVREQTKWVIPDGVEPHWVAPGRAYLWQEQIVRERKEGPDGWHVEEKNMGWVPTGPVPFNNATQIGQWLDHGLRLRPPKDGVSLETLRENAIDPVQELPEQEPAPFSCSRHPSKGGKMRFKTWRAYVAHCRAYRETIVEKAPEEVAKRIAQYPYYCRLHDRGFMVKRLAARHLNNELRKVGPASHPTLEQMEVHQNGVPLQ